MSYKCTCIKWDFLIAGAQSALYLLCSALALIRFVLCSTLLYSVPLLLLFVVSLLPPIYLLFGSSGLASVYLCVFVAQAQMLPCSHAPRT